MSHWNRDQFLMQNPGFARWLGEQGGGVAYTAGAQAFTERHAPPKVRLRPEDLPNPQHRPSQQELADAALRLQRKVAAAEAAGLGSFQDASKPTAGQERAAEQEARRDLRGPRQSTPVLLPKLNVAPTPASRVSARLNRPTQSQEPGESFGERTMRESIERHQGRGRFSE